MQKALVNSGIYAVAPNGNISDEVLQSNISGVILKYDWYDLQSVDGSLRISDFHNKAKRIYDAGKKLHIGLMTGTQGTAYLFPKIQKIKFTEYRRKGKGQQFTTWLPDIINPEYFKTWNEFLNDFLSWIITTEIWQHVVCMKVTGINFTTLELRLPYLTPVMMPEGKKDVTDAIALWKEHKYTEDYVLWMFAGIIDTMRMKITDGTWLSLPMLSGQAFPCIDSKGKEYDFKSRANMAIFFASYLIDNYPNSALQYNALSRDSKSPSLIFNAPAKLRGMQLNMSMYEKSQAAKEDFEIALMNGINQGASWIEVSESNVIVYKEIVERINQHMQ